MFFLFEALHSPVGIPGEGGRRAFRVSQGASHPRACHARYAGSQSAASHVLAELQKIKQDFADAISDSNSDESQASSDYDDFKSDPPPARARS